MATKIVKCTCQHEQQDNMYGKGNRVANSTSKANQYRCTVCKTLRVEKSV